MAYMRLLLTKTLLGSGQCLDLTESPGSLALHSANIQFTGNELLLIP